MVRVPGSDIVLRIFCDGKYLPEYSVVLEGTKVTCWIPSEEGKVRGSIPSHFLPYVSSSSLYPRRSKYASSLNQILMRTTLLSAYILMAAASLPRLSILVGPVPMTA